MAPRNLAERTAGVRAKLQTDEDCWVASASETGEAYLIPLSFWWDGARLTLATPEKSRTVRNLRRAGVVRIGLGPTRDVVLLDGTVAFTPLAEIEPEVADAFAKHTGFDPRKLDEEYVYLRVTPQTVQAWREADELTGRFVMREGRWLADEA
jgi:nitroimidazol reductase NimA-like FMN-containing flavoprotein (pyridoxamine 5'-phosphate oxidase superfamily)